LDQTGKILDLVWLFAGCCAVVFSLVSIVQTRNFIGRSVEVTGEVISLKRSAGSRGVTYAPIFSFTTVDGNAYTVTSDVSSSPAGFDVGECVRVRYDPAHPENARIHSFFQTWGIAAPFGLVGAAFIAYSCNALGVLHLTNQRF